ncbi:transcriptional corepressor Cyc8 [Cordyceps fumosorosea ARSEF 2679]|uniref:Transcriptional corepressor Cyc8 n=1 Tax=Cordyceps fumosorosea (strain ARSEF 2679) TaxID=1081104 RepID=A0A162JMU4_CORFA|nr:transcriptional corepressor Cyc8 [Cordyceps fumosorosea ARSEF 2679]OAA71202.1 transcriptional corepressor Cyc8 [Cordyceps fumosorosea ARSEF 2679]
MAANHHPSPTMMQMQHQQAQAPGGPPHAGPSGQYSATAQIQQLNEQVWLQIGSFSELLRTPDEALQAYERALIANPQSITALNAIGMLLKGREAFDKALEFFRTIVDMDRNNGEAWGNLGHCFLMTENLQKAYDAYQQALVNLQNPKDPMLWYGIGILYDRYGSYDYAEEAFSQVMQIQPDFEKANEIYFRLGIIYKQQQKYQQSLECFKYIVTSPPGPLTQEDIWFQIGHVHEQQKDFDSAKAAYQRVLDHSPAHAKVLQQLGWLHHQQSSSYEYQDRAIQYLEKSVNADNTDAQSWYLLGRCYMSQQKYPKAYEAYQQAVYRDGKNPTFWCSIGVLYYQINQYRDALDAYSRAIRLNPYISEVWYDLGTLYESCNNQISDALDAYQRAAELDPGNPHIKNRLQLLRSGNGGALPAAPQPADVHPQAYQATGPQGPTGPQWAGSTAQPPAGGPPPAPQGAGENWARNLSNVNPPPQPPNPYESRGEPFRGGPAPPLQRPPSPQHDIRQPPPDHRQVPPPQQQSHYSDRPLPSRRASPPPPHAYAPTSQARVTNPNFGGSTPSASAPPTGVGNGPAVPPLNGAGPFRPTHSPRPDGREGHVPSPKPAYPGQTAPPPPQYPSQGEALPPSSENGQTGPAPTSAAPDVAVQRQDDRPPSVGPKRMREWEDEAAVKKQANEENRARLEDVKHRRPSMSPKEGFRRPSPRSEEHRGEEARRAEESGPKSDYHPSEAAHHHTQHSVTGNQLPPMQTSALSDAAAEKAQPTVTPKEEPTETSSAPRAPATSEPERAARKMDVDEDYDDAPEDDKKAAATNGSKAGSTTDEAKPSSPTSTGAKSATAATVASATKSE